MTLIQLLVVGFVLRVQDQVHDTGQIHSLVVRLPNIPTIISYVLERRTEIKQAAR